jgi:hypothetical protein
MKLQFHLFCMLALGSLAPGAGWADPVVAGSAGGASHLTGATDPHAPPRPQKHNDANAHPQLHDHASAASAAVRPQQRQGFAPAANARFPTPVAASSVLRGLSGGPGTILTAPRVSATLPAQHVVAVRQLTPSYLRRGNAAGLSGGAVRRSASVPVMLGGPAPYRAKDGAMIGGTVLHSRP